ncbi:MAG: tetraacyldisaccharide 4'-kinase [Rhodospirillales bacterium]|nr:MAG: tetraacyldisaccharide 4'-kinase [Rhodospirillales bacterium]
MRAPEFWYRTDPGSLATLLAPAAWAWQAATARRWRRASPWTAPVPVICVGNVVAGGAGKTPVTLSLGERLAALGVRVHFLSRGHGGNLSGPVQVDPDRHTAAEVGDEPLLLAAAAPTWVSRDRPAGARAAVAAGAGAVVMDDGFQNPSVAKSLSLLVVDGRYGFGNGRIVPAGPLREPVASALARTSAVVLMGPDEAGVTAAVNRRRPVLRAHLKPGPDASALAGRRVLAFAGIGHPEKFLATLQDLGARVVASRAFADHHRYRTDELAALLRQARALDALPVTTAKDAVRIPEGFRARVTVILVAVVWEDAPALDRVLAPVLAPELAHAR